jgi:hypothetical protein
MPEERKFQVFKDVVVSESALLRLEPKKNYGTVPGLDESELADLDELERQVLIQEFAPVLALPFKAKKNAIKPATDGDGNVDWGAFGTVDFDRYRPKFDKAKYKVDRLKEQLGDVLIMFSIVKERIKSTAKYLVLKYLRMGIIDLEHIVDDDMLALGRLYVRVRRMQKEMAGLREASRHRRERRLKAFLES